MLSEKEEKYEPELNGQIRDYKYIRGMLVDVRASIAKQEPSFGEKSLREVLDVVEGGRYSFSGVLFDLSSALADVKSYRRNSEKSCRSCQYFKHSDVKADSDRWFFYCGHYEKGWYSRVVKGTLRPKNGKPKEYVGFSPTTKEFFNKGCEKWKPQLSPILDSISD